MLNPLNLISKLMKSYIQRRFSFAWVPGERQRVFAKKLGFTSVASSPMVRSSYHADQQMFSN